LVFFVTVPGNGTQIGCGSGSGQNFGSSETLVCNVFQGNATYNEVNLKYAYVLNLQIGS